MLIVLKVKKNLSSFVFAQLLRSSGVKEFRSSDNSSERIGFRDYSALGVWSELLHF
jgi:hypothetical protein